MTGPAWKQKAACKGTPTNHWYPAATTSSKPALAVCATCPVIDPCLEWALTHEEVFGVWGGTRPYKRRQLIKQRNRQQDQL